MGSSEAEIVTRSQLDAAPADVWAWIVTFVGINDELRPWLRMTAPRAVRERGLAEVVVGERLCRSWILALGVIPIDYDDITVIRLDEGRGFLERSPMFSQSLWEHERTLEPSGAGCGITDRIRYRPRPPIPTGALRPVLAAVFRHRHRRLQRHFGGRPVR